MELKVQESEPTQLTIDGKPSSFESLNISADIRLPFDVVKIDGEMSFDTEVWINGDLRHLMPGDTDWARTTIASYEAGNLKAIDLDIPQDESSWREALQRLQHERQQHDGAINHTAWDRIRRMHALYRLNYEDLQQVFEESLSDEVFFTELIASTADAAKRDARLAKIDKVVHNFVQSAYSLEGQLKIVIGPYRNTEFWRRYTEKHETVHATGEVAFALKMREFLTHQTLPYPQLSFSFSGETATSTSLISISIEELSAYTGWGGVAERFIAAAGESVDLFMTLKDSFVLVDELAAWTIRQANVLNKIHRRLVDELILESAWIQTSGRDGRPRFEWALAPEVLSKKST